MGTYIVWHKLTSITALTEQYFDMDERTTSRTSRVIIADTDAASSFISTDMVLWFMIVFLFVIQRFRGLGRSIDIDILFAQYSCMSTYSEGLKSDTVIRFLRDVLVFML